MKKKNQRSLGVMKDEASLETRFSNLLLTLRIPDSKFASPQSGIKISLQLIMATPQTCMTCVVMKIITTPRMVAKRSLIEFSCRWASGSRSVAPK